MTNPPKLCDCGAEFTPRPSNYAKAKRCPACAAKRRKSGTGAASRRRDREKAQANFEETQIIAFDGEGVTQVSYLGDAEPHTDPNDDNFWLNHVYQGMVAFNEATGEEHRITCPADDRLHTGEILRWLWARTSRDKTGDEHKLGPRKQGWFFSSKYDWTAIFRDIIIEDVVSGQDIRTGTLWQIMHPDQTPDGQIRNPFDPVWWTDETGRHWGIIYIQGTVSLLRRIWDRELKEWRTIGKRIFSDAFRCFGTMAFTEMLKAWEVGTPDEIAEIAAMKEQRGHFTMLTPQIMDYCAHEVRLLAQAIKKITTIFGQDPINIRPSAWYSAGSAAKCLLRNHMIPADPKTGWEGFRGPDRYAGAPDDIKTILLRTYIGGWFENAETGLFKELHSEDFKSAYPATIRDLPCLAHGHWERNYNGAGINFGHVEWEETVEDLRQLRWAPFPWRWPNGRIYRPYRGEGWYCEAEIRAAQRMPGYRVDEIEWISFVPECDHKPFEWVQEVYDLRIEWGGDGRGLALKITLNSVYGVFADTLSLDSRYASIVWASLITSGTRAKIVNLIAEQGDKIVSVATDGILSTSPVLGKKTKVLGELNYEGAITDVLLIQPGLYLASQGPDPKKTIRNRGHALKDMREIEQRLRAAWLEHGWAATVRYSRVRFIPAKLALARTDPLAVYGQWLETPITLKFTPTNRDQLAGPGPRRRSVPSARHLFMIDPDSDDQVSAPYDRLLSMLHNQTLIEERELANAQP